MITMNVNKFKEILMKGTLNYSIDCIQLNFAEGMMRSAMMSGENDIVTLLDMQNDFITLPQHDEVSFNFSQPSIKLLPFLETIDEEEAGIELSDEQIVLTYGQFTSNVHFCHRSVLQRNILNRNQKDDFEYYTELEANESFFNIFNKIKRIGVRFGKIYTNVENGKFRIQTTDRSNMAENGIYYDFHSVDSDDVVVCFNFKNFVNLMSVVEYEFNKEDGKRFMLRFAYLDDRGGMVHAISTDETEQYFLLNREI
jgi:hypothetical protein